MPPCLESDDFAVVFPVGVVGCLLGVVLDIFERGSLLGTGGLVDGLFGVLTGTACFATGLFGVEDLLDLFNAGLLGVLGFSSTFSALPALALLSAEFFSIFSIVPCLVDALEFLSCLVLPFFVVDVSDFSSSLSFPDPPVLPPASCTSND